MKVSFICLLLAIPFLLVQPASALTCPELFSLKLKSSNPGKSSARALAIINFVDSGALNRIDETEAAKIGEASEALHRYISPYGLSGIILAHRVGAGAVGRDGTSARIGNYTQEQLNEKAHILALAGFSQSERRVLIEKGIAGIKDLIGWARTKPEPPKPNLSSEKVDDAIDQVLDSNNYETVAVDLSQISIESGKDIEAGIAKKLSAEKPKFFVQAKANNTENRYFVLFKALKAKFPDLVQDPQEGEMNNMEINEALDQLLDSGMFSPENPLTLLIEDFVPTSTSYEPFSGMMRGWYNRKASDETYKALKVIITSRTPISEWGSAQGGFNVGSHHLIEP